MSASQPKLLGPDGKPVPRRPKSTACPKCRAAKDKRINTAGFGPACIVCGVCGHPFPEDEC